MVLCLVQHLLQCRVLQWVGNNRTHQYRLGAVLLEKNSTEKDLWVLEAKP